MKKVEKKNSGQDKGVLSKVNGDSTKKDKGGSSDKKTEGDSKAKSTPNKKK